jgi:hypothetical protein
MYLIEHLILITGIQKPKQKFATKFFIIVAQYHMLYDVMVMLFPPFFKE